MIKPSSTFSRFTRIILILLVIAALLAGVFYLDLTGPRCMTLTADQPKQFSQQSNQGLIEVAHRLGANEPLQTCTGDTSTYTSPDGYGAFAMRIPGSGKEQVDALGCPARPANDRSNGQKASYAKQAFRNGDKITGYYSPEGARCGVGDMLVILTATTPKDEDIVYVVYQARFGR